MNLHYRVVPKDLHAHIFQIELTIDKPNPVGQVFALPNWIPGSYLIRDFSKNIISISAKSGDQAVRVKKIDKNHWISYPCEKPITLEYEVYAFDLSVRSAYLSSERAFFNGTSLFLLPLGHEHEPCEVEICYPTKDQIGDWACATSMSQVSKDKNKECFQAANYLDLIEHPVEMADFTRFVFEAGGVEHEMTLSGRHKTDIARLRSDLTKICSHHIGFFNDNIPFDRYLFLTLVRTKGYGGLEHKKSTSLICSRKDLPVQNMGEISKDYTRFLALCSHEYFHAWWVKTIKPCDFHQIDLDRENHTEQLWVYEGFTSYYDELSLIRTRLLNPEQYLNLFAETITRVKRSAGQLRQSLSESSFDAWTKFYQQDENAANAIVSYYTKGALVAFILDIEIRRRTKDRICLDDVVRHIYEHYQDKGTENNTVKTVVESLTNEDFSEFFDQYLHGREMLDLTHAFDYLGIDIDYTHKPKDLTDFGINVRAEKDASVITQVFDNSCCQSAGLYVGDKIISIDYIKVKQEDLASVFEGSEDGDVLQVGLLRDELLMQIPLKIYRNQKTFCELKIRSDIDPLTQKRQNQWLYGA